MHIAIIGATGLIGSSLVTELIGNESTKQITVITRKKMEAESNKIHQIVIPEMTSDKIEGLNINADAYFCGLGTTIKKAGSRVRFRYVDCDLVVAFAKLANNNKKALLVISAMGANKNSSVFYNRVKGDMEGV
ncbi:MAG: NAD-dependent epimerase/dehydratase family protein [Desulfobulbaceae bacterium]|nr:NAD-dependent epimerase/dehydratase family protein [Desulfobulbaceae bacterium]